MDFTPTEMVSTTMSFIGQNIFFLEVVFVCFIFLFMFGLFYGSLRKMTKKVFR